MRIFEYAGESKQSESERESRDKKIGRLFTIYNSLVKEGKSDMKAPGKIITQATRNQHPKFKI